MTPPARRLPDTPRPTALLLIDLQNDFCHPDGVFAAGGLRVADLEGLVSRTNALAAAARSGGVPVIWVRMVYDTAADAGLLLEASPVQIDEALRTGTWGAELLDGLDVRPEDRRIDKSRFSAFHRTDLEDLLNEAGIRRLVIAGVRTDVCVETTVRDAFMRDLEVALAADASASYIPDLHHASLRALGVIFAEIADQRRATTILRGRAAPG
ncbi:isochorismatase [Actinomadura cremea]|nr:isochorismatase [Actinomadura cremea]